jgi:hypothetical protein
VINENAYHKVRIFVDGDIFKMSQLTPLLLVSNIDFRLGGSRNIGAPMSSVYVVRRHVEAFVWFGEMEARPLPLPFIA